MKGLIHIYCGDGKGKTTCATGLAIRMVGAGKKVVFSRFLKEETSSELKVLLNLPGIVMCCCDKCFGFVWNMTEDMKREAKQYYADYFVQVVEKAKAEKADMLVLDELVGAYNYQLVNQQEVLRFLREKPEHLEVVLTGRNPGKELIELADYVSQIQKIKHPYDQGICARTGIEK